MITKLVPIGTSKGIRISKAILQQCGMRDAIELEVKGHEIILKPYKHKPREGWAEFFTNVDTSLTDEDKEWLNFDDKIDDEWEWK